MQGAHRSYGFLIFSFLVSSCHLEVAILVFFLKLIYYFGSRIQSPSSNCSIFCEFLMITAFVAIEIVNRNCIMIEKKNILV